LIGINTYLFGQEDQYIKSQYSVNNKLLDFGLLLNAISTSNPKCTNSLSKLQYEFANPIVNKHNESYYLNITQILL
jgi:hypothetical protein